MLESYLLKELFWYDHEGRVGWIVLEMSASDLSIDSKAFKYVHAALFGMQWAFNSLLSLGFCEQDSPKVVIHWNL